MDYNYMKEKELNERLMTAVFRMSRIVKHKIAFSSRMIQLTHIQLEMLMYLNQHKKIKGTEIAKYFNISKPTASSHIDKLVQLKLINRATDKEDRRIDWLTLTKKGKKLLDEGIKRRNEIMNKLLKLISTKDKINLLTIIVRLLSKLE